MFVCTGNICRSPTAERLAVARSANLPIPDLHFSSAGTQAVIGHRIHDQAALVLRSLGGDPEDFYARQLTQKMAMAADLILTMTRGHRDAVLEVAPQMMRRTFLLTEASRLVTELGAGSLGDLSELRPYLDGDDLADVPDPIGREADVFLAVGEQIATLLPPVLELCRLGAVDD
ncbi:low molecular weight phosphatase family protein [Mycobacterium sp. pV006]|uniref:arsenate reductase/protein-tyrosine-phosphatase family protein n=1 Tax=Mycobacterium sp. pV006 TaxID=3238983 RepID=UPI00351B0751